MQFTPAGGHLAMTHHPLSPRRGLVAILAVSLLTLVSDIAAAQSSSPNQLRQLIDGQVGGIQKLMAPAHDPALPQPRLSNGVVDPRFAITEAKRYLGKQLFHDP